MSTFHPVNLATTVVPVGRGIMAAKAVVNAAEIGVVRTIAGNVVRSAPEAAGYGALQHIEANPQTSGADLIKGVLKNVAVTGGVTAAGGLAGAAANTLKMPGKPVPPGKTLYAYSPELEWDGDIMKTGKGQGRLWASEHAPGPWVYATDAKNTAIRAWRTGRIKPFNSMSPEITGAAAAKFSSPNAIGPLRAWKRAAGQYYTDTPGNMNLKTGEFVPPTLRQRYLRGQDTVLSHGADAIVDAGIGVLAGTPAAYYYVNQPESYAPASSKNTGK